MTHCEQILKERGPLMSGALVEQLVSKLGVKANNASKIIVRDKSIIRISGFFKSGQHLCFLKEHKEEIVFLKEELERAKK